MPLFDALPAFAAALPRSGPVAGLDLGTRTLGVAVSDAGRMIATPVTTLKRSRFATDSQALLALLDERGCGGVVLGLPREMDGGEGARCQATRAFARNLLAVRDMPLLLWDERLSTAAVERMLVEEADLSRGRRAQVVDRAAAAFILQGVLDAPALRAV